MNGLSNEEEKALERDARRWRKLIEKLDSCNDEFGKYGDCVIGLYVSTYGIHDTEGDEDILIREIDKLIEEENKL